MNTITMPFSNMSPLELLKEFNNRVCEYDKRRDDELRFLEDHPNRDFWDDEQDEEYESILTDIDFLYGKLNECSDYINTLVHA